MKIGFDTPVTCVSLIGRAVELDNLCLYIDNPKGARHKVTLISGEAGIGKSRLIREARNRSLSKGFYVFQGNCFQTDRDTPYASLIDLLRTLLPNDSTEQHTNDQPLGKFLSHNLVQFFPELMALKEDTRTQPSLDPEQEKRRLFATLANFFLDCAKQRSLVLIIEDMHWSDDSTREFLLYMARQSQDRSIIFICTYRTEELNPTLRHWLAELDREHLAHELILSRLSRQDVNHMVQDIFSLDHSMYPEVVDTLYTLTDGNPFFIEEVLKSLVATGQISESADVVNLRSLSELRIPRTVQDSVQRRFTELSDEAQHVITLAAVAGRRFDFPLLQHLLACNEHQLLQYIKELIAAQLVNEESGDRFAFRHALTRQAIYKSLLVRERRTLHLTIGTVSEELYVTSLSAHVSDLAYHFFEAEIWSKALDYSRQAGERALVLFTPQAAVEHFKRAIHSALQLEEMNALATLYQARGQANDHLGNFETSRLDYMAALEIATAKGDTAHIWSSLIAIGFLWSGRDYVQAGRYFQQALEVANEAHDSLLQARSLNRIGNWLVNIGKPAEGLAKHYLALAIFEEWHDQHGMAETFDLLGMADGQYGNIPNAVNHYGRAVQLFRETGDQLGLISSLTASGTYTSLAWNETGYAAIAFSDKGTRDLEEALRLSRQIGAPSSQAYAEWISAVACGSKGNFGQGMAHARQALQIALEIGHQQWLTAARFSLGQLYVWMHAPDLAIPELQAGLTLALQLGSAWWIGNITYCLASAYLLKNDLHHTQAILESAMSSNQLPSNLQERRMRWMWGNLALAQADALKALHIADELIASVPHDGELQPVPWLLKLKAEALSVLKQPEEAILAFEQAAEAAKQRNDYRLLWQILCGQGWIFREINQRTKAQSAFALARDMVARLAASIDSPDLADQFVRAATSRFPKEEPRSKQTGKYEGLTHREQEVAIQISQGKSNREIADQLIIGERTVETHVSNILSKLNLQSRRQITKWVASHAFLNH
ncbi:MAG: AAA family ATPase [Anaerolineae bacterium]|nr:AAA family ATPase [Anaerolineae bacterium]